MINKEDYYLLGKIIRSHGIKGEVVIYMDADDPLRYKKIKTIFIEEQNELKEYTVLSIRINSNEATVLLAGINDRNTSELYIKRNIFLPLTSLPKLKGKQFYFHEVIGFDLADAQLGVIGKVVNVYEMPQHPILAVDHSGAEVLIPAIKDFIVKIKREEKLIEMNLPDGLLEVYLKK